MGKKAWKTSDFVNWMTASGLSAAQAAVVLGVSERTVKRLRNDDAVISEELQDRADQWVRSTRVTKGKDALNLDSAAAIMDFADLCASHPYAHITCLTAAIARGWTSANAHNFRHLAQPERMPQPTKSKGFDLVWFSTTDLPWGVECRIDSDGRPYRIASPERTLIELAVHDHLVGGDEVSEAIQGAKDLANSKIDWQLVHQRAVARRPEAAEAIDYHLSAMARAAVADGRRYGD